ncbi:multidrug resistance protein 3-like protein [Blastocladiella britannica]|nr:multidrug resistance protein 3-like protein [Blastocladiella britannica]
MTTATTTAIADDAPIPLVDTMRGTATTSATGLANPAAEMGATTDSGSSKGDGEDAATPSPPVASVASLFRFADATDYLLMFIGGLGAVGYGVTQPIISVILGDIVQPFIAYEMIRANPGLPASVLDAAAEDLKTKVVKQTLMFIGIGCATMFGAYLMQAFWSWAGERQARMVRAKFITAVMRQDIAWFDSNKAGDLTTQLTSDTLLFQEGISERAAQGVAYSTQFIAGFVIAFVQSWKLTLVLLATLPAFAVSGIVVGRVFSTGTATSQAAYSAAGAVAQEVLANIRTVAAFGGQQRAIRKFDALLESVVKANERKAWIAGAGFGTFFGLLYLLFGLGFWYGAKLVGDLEISGGDVLKVLFSITIGSFSILNLSPSIQALAKARGAAGRLFEVIDSRAAIVSGTRTLEDLRGALAFEDVDFAYPSRPDVSVLDKFSMTAEAGTTVALVGLSGSGKSTTIQLLERYFDVLGGSVKVDGVDLRELELKWLRSRIGLVSQEPILFDATIGENIAYGAPEGTHVTQEMLEKAARDANAHEFISKLPNGYNTMVGERGSLLSGGQKQRIAIARVNLKNPKILLLDEATSALDTESEGIVQEALEKASAGRTTIVIAHRLSTIRGATKIICMDKGKIVEQGTHDELIARGAVYAGLVKAQELIMRQGASRNKLASAATDIGADEGSDSDELDDVDQKQDMKKSAASVSAAAAARPGTADKKDPAATTKGGAGVVDMLAEAEREEREKAAIKELLAQRSVPLWRVAKMQWLEWPVLITGVICGTINGLLLPAFGIILGKVLTVFQETGQALQDKALIYLYVFLGLTAMNFVLNLFQFGCFGVAGERLTKRIRVTTFEAFLRQDLAFFDDEKNGTGALTAILAEQADRIQNLTGPNLANLLQLIVSMGSAVGLAFYYSWKLTLVVLACVPVLAIGSFIEVSVNQGSAGKTRQAYATAGQRACDAIINIATVKSLVREDDFIAGYLESVKMPYRAGVKKALLGSWGFGFSQAVQFFVYAIAFYSGYRFVLDGGVTAGDVFNTIFVILFGAISFAQAATFTSNVQKAKVAAIGYFDLIDRVPAIDVTKEGGLTPVDVAGEVQVTKGEFAYPGRPDAQILKGLDFEALAGKSVALVGPSGSGKSTVLALALRHYELQSGTTSVEKYDVKDWNLRYLREQMAVVSQEPALFIGTLRENIEYGVRDGDTVTDDQVYAAAKAANIHDFIMSLPEGYDTSVTSSQLSGGQKQRVCIARSLIRNPKILLLDEATSALDSAAEKVVQQALDAAAQGRTTISIAHRLSTIQGCDQIFVVKNGTVQERGTHFELLDKQGLYYKLCKRQQLTK